VKLATKLTGVARVSDSESEVGSVVESEQKVSQNQEYRPLLLEPFIHIPVHHLGFANA